MPLPDQTPRLPKWPFLLGDAALLAAGWLIADQAAHPLTGEAVVAVVACAIAAALVGVIPFLTDYARRQDEALDDRQRSLEALSRTAGAAAEQISIAAGGFHEITELAQKNLKHAEQLPHKLQEKIAEFQARLAQSREEENDEMEKELTALRSSESERLESTADKVTRAAAEWARVEAASQKHLAAVKIVLAELDERIARLKAAQAAPSGKPPTDASERRPYPASAEPYPSIEPPATPSAAPEAHLDSKPAVHGRDGSPSRPEAIESPTPDDGRASRASAPPEPASSAAPDDFVLPTDVPLKAAEPAKADDPAQAEAPPVKPPRKRAAKKAPKEAPAAEAPKGEEPTLGLDEPAAPALEFSQTAGEDAAPVDSVSSDGATRLIVTAYIGIGNRLFIRGEGAGLSWERGVPLQFVSIGRWRWEALDVTGPVTYKLYKNDEAECVALGAQGMEPGHQQEVTATF